MERWRGTIFSVASLTLTRWRKQGKGPDFIKIGPHVYYPEQAVAAFEAAALQTNSTDTDA